MATLNGIDVSRYQTAARLHGYTGPLKINGPLMISDAVPYDFLIAKATEGTGYVDANCNAHIAKAKKRGKLTAVYHFATKGGTAEADFFVNQVRGYIGNSILVLDWEAGALAHGVGAAKAFLDRVYARTKVRPLLYTSASVTTAYDWSGVCKNYGLWVASYPNNNATGYYTPALCKTGAWGFAAMRQYSSHGRLPGYSGYLDLDIFYGDKAAWQAYAAGTAPAPNPNPNPNPTPEEETVYAIKFHHPKNAKYHPNEEFWGLFIPSAGGYLRYGDNGTLNSAADAWASSPGVTVTAWGHYRDRKNSDVDRFSLLGAQLN